jgi:hypothetical protein
MFDTNSQNFPPVRLCGGSSTLLLGDETAAHEFYHRVTTNLYKELGEIGYLCPEIFDYEDWRISSLPYDDEQKKTAAKSLNSPREILYQTLGKKICFGGDLIYFGGVTFDLVEKYNSQELKSIYRREELALVCNESGELEYTGVLEYPEFDDFGNPTKISWLAEYALRAEEFSKSSKADLFLNLEWNRPRSELPTPFWLLFDRIYEIKGNGNDTVNIVQIR